MMEMLVLPVVMGLLILWALFAPVPGWLLEDEEEAE